MKVRDIIELLETEYPASSAESWDNPGLQAGDEDWEVQRIMVSLDATDEVIDLAVKEKVQMLITHHPMIFSPLKKINNESLTGRRVLKLIQNGIACFAMHTNFDIRGMAQINEEQLGLENTQVLFETGEFEGEPEGIGRIGDLPKEMTVAEVGELVKKALEIPNVRCYGDLSGKVKRAAISSGSGRSMVGSALTLGAQVLITGDIDYHTGIDALAEGLQIIDAGHFGTEKVFIKYMEKKLTALLKEKGCIVLAADQGAPFTVL